MPLLQVTDLHASYQGCLALRGASIFINQGEIVGLCGPNKAGKSTLCKCLAGSKTPDSGKVLFDGRDVTSTPCFRRLALGLSLCPEGRGIYPGMSVRDNLRMGYENHSSTDGKERLEQVFGYFPVLSERLKQQAGTLSGGEAQMLGIARKLLRKPRLLIVDEPALGLSPAAINAVFSALSQVRKESGISVLVTEEVVSRLSARVDRLYMLNLGVIDSVGAFELSMDSRSRPPQI